MEACESDKAIASYIENEDEGSSSEEDSEEESDDNVDEEDDDGTDVLSEEEDEDETGAISEEEDEETISDDDAGNGNGGEAGSAAAVEEGSDKEEDTFDLGDPDMSCPICLNEFAGQDLGSPENCNHTFCFECIMEWSKNINTCPIDRIEFHLVYMKQEINGDVIKKVKVKVKKEVEEYVEEVTLCEVCRLGDREDRLLLCDSCDSGYHCECLDPPLETIPIEEWFCPPCSRVLNRRASTAQASHSRLIARTSASEIVRSRIQHHRTANSGDSGSETTQHSHRVHSPARAPKRRKTTKRKRKTTRKSSKSKRTTARTKATAAGKSKLKKGSSKTSPKRKRKTKRRKSVKKKKKSKKSWLASMKLVAPSVKKRIADHLGLCKPPSGQSMPYVKKSGNHHSSFVEQLPSLNVFGCRDMLFDFNESYTDDDLDNPKPCSSKQRSQAIAVSRSSMAVASTSGINLLDNILEKQNDLLRNSKNITIGKDGSLNVKENSFVKGKCGVKNLNNGSKNDESVLEQSKTTTSSSSSSVHVKKEKDVSATDSPSADMGKNISESTSLLVSALSCTIKKEKPYSHPRVRFNDTETIFRISDPREQIEKKLLAAEAECNQPCSYPSVQEKEVPSEKASSSIKKEKDDDYLLNPLMDTKSINTEQASLDVNRNKLKEHRVEENCQFHKSGISSPLSFLNSTCKGNSKSMASSSSASTNNLHVPFVTGKCNSTKDVSSGSSEPVCEKRGDTSKSLFGKAENDRKRHLPFLSNGLHRPFKIPKLVKSVDKSLSPEVKLPSSENINNDLDHKVLSEPENVAHKNRTYGHLVSELKTKSAASECDLKLENGDQKNTSTDHTDQIEAMDIDTDGDQSTVSGAATNCSLQQTKKENVNKLYKNHQNSNQNSKSSLHMMPKLSDPEKNKSSGNKYSSEGLVNNLHKDVSHASPSSLNSDFMKCNRKNHVKAPTSSSKRIKSIEPKCLLTVNSSEGRTSELTTKSPAVENTELKASGKMPAKVPSRHKLMEDIAAEIKKHLKDFYVTDLITKEEYKEIMRRSVPKVFQNCGNSIDSAKIRKLVVSYVQIIGNTKSDSS